MIIDYKLSIKGIQCQIYGEKKDYNATCGSGQKCNTYIAQKVNFQYINI